VISEDDKGMSFDHMSEVLDGLIHRQELAVRVGQKCCMGEASLCLQKRGPWWVSSPLVVIL
jgi:hypothetical protein